MLRLLLSEESYVGSRKGGGSLWDGLVREREWSGVRVLFEMGRWCCVLDTEDHQRYSIYKPSGMNLKGIDCPDRVYIL